MRPTVVDSFTFEGSTYEIHLLGEVACSCEGSRCALVFCRGAVVVRGSWRPMLVRVVALLAPTLNEDIHKMSADGALWLLDVSEASVRPDPAFISEMSRTFAGMWTKMLAAPSGIAATNARGGSA